MMDSMERYGDSVLSVVPQLDGLMDGLTAKGSDEVREIVREARYSVAVSLIDTELQDRQLFRPDKLEELADSIAANGLAEPIILRPHPRGATPGRMLVVAGERRFRAVQLLGWSHITAYIRQLDDREAARSMWLENSQRVDLNPMDEAHAIKRRMDAEGWTVAAAAKELGLRESTVRDRLALLRIPQDLQRMIAYEQVSSGYGVAMALLSDCPDYLEAQSLAMFYFANKRKWMLDEFRRVVNHLREQYFQRRFIEREPVDLTAPDAGMQVWNQWMASIVSLRPTVKSPTGPVPAPASSNAGPISGIGASGRYPARQDLPRMKRSASIMAALQKLYDDMALSSSPEVQEASLVIGHVINELTDLGLARRP